MNDCAHGFGLPCFLCGMGAIEARYARTRDRCEWGKLRRIAWYFPLEGGGEGHVLLRWFGSGYQPGMSIVIQER